MNVKVRLEMQEFRECKRVTTERKDQVPRRVLIPLSCCRHDRMYSPLDIRGTCILRCILRWSLCKNVTPAETEASADAINSWPCILGEDLAGEIIAVGEGVSNLKVGQRVLAHASFLVSKVLQTASFQEQVIVPAIQVAPIPDSMKYEDATVLPLAISTAAAGLFQSRESLALALDLPSENPKKTGKTVLIWGGSSSVGMTCIQLAVASGATVLTTCSPRNNALVEGLGAKAFDYNSPSIVGDLIDELKKGEFVGAYDCKYHLSRAWI